MSLKKMSDSTFIIECPHCFKSTEFKNVEKSYLDYNLLECIQCDKLVSVKVTKVGE